MRVFQMNTFCGKKSTGRIATDIACLLEKQGAVCKIGFGAEDVPAQWERFSYRIGGPLERKVHGALRKLLDAEGYGSHWGTIKLISAMKRFQPDVVHLHNIHGCYLNFRLLFRFIKKAGLPVVWTLHDCWPFTGHCAYFDYADCQKWQSVCGRCPQQRSYPVCYGLDGSKRNYRHKKRLFGGLSKLTLVTPCHWLEEKVKQSFLQACPVQVIHNGVDRNVFRPASEAACEALSSQYGLEGKHVVLSVAADWDERKGLRFLLDMASRLSSEYQVVALGLSQKQIQSLPAGVLGLTATSHVQELVTWYSLADCLANPTLEDNMPMVNLEALACGTPVAVFQTGGCPEVVDETCGKVVPKGDAVGLALAVCELSTHKKELREACLRRSALFDSEACYQQYLSLYKEICQP